MSRFPSHIWRKAVCKLPIPPAQRLVLLALAEYADYQTGRDAWPGRARLMADTGMGKGTVDRALNAGRKHGVIVQTASGHRGANPVFHLVRPESAPVEALKRPTTDVESAPVVGRQPTHIPTPRTTPMHVSSSTVAVAPSELDSDERTFASGDASPSTADKDDDVSYSGGGYSSSGDALEEWRSKRESREAPAERDEPPRSTWRELFG